MVTTKRMIPYKEIYNIANIVIKGQESLNQKEKNFFKMFSLKIKILLLVEVWADCPTYDNGPSGATCKCICVNKKSIKT